MDREAAAILASTADETEDSIPRKELLLLVMQALNTCGLESTRQKMEEECNLQLESDAVAKLHKAILSGNWTLCADALQELSLPLSLQREVSLLIAEQQYLELIACQDISAAYECLQNTVAPAQECSRRLKQVSSYLMCLSLADVESSSKWKLRGSRHALWNQCCALFPSSLIVPPKRLSVLLHQALR